MSIDRARRLLAFYFSDDDGGSVGGLAFARRSAVRYRGTGLGAFLEDFIADLLDDRSALRALLNELERPDSVHEPAIDWSRRKTVPTNFGVRDITPSPLSQAVTLEALIAGSRARAMLFRTLHTLVPPLQSRRFSLASRRVRALEHVETLQEFLARTCERAQSG